ncbi:MAG: metallophosphoesterase [Candidatus Aenigmarchaeota archaeon]|nr:metallophosphoesterase [Candidatus Aenigmarchaeota archaeon]
MERKKLKILAASDIHEDTKAVKRLAEKAEKYEVELVVLAGDLTYFDNDWHGMIGPFLEKKKYVFFVAGNHDSIATAGLLAEKYKINNLQDRSAVINDVGFFGCGGGNVGVNVLSDREIFDTLKRGFKKVGEAGKKIMVTHMHPARSVIEKISEFPGSAGVRKAKEELEPDIHLCGHIHETEGLEEKIGKTRVISLGKQGRVLEL